MKKYFFVWIVPLLWLVISVLSIREPGDDWGGWLWVFGSIAGSWIIFLSSADYYSITTTVSILGTIIMTIGGFCMDRLKISKKVFFIIAGIIAMVILTLNEMEYYGNTITYVDIKLQCTVLTLSCNLGLTITTAGSIIVGGLVTGWKSLRRA